MARPRRRRKGGGRPRKPGARTPSGRLSQARAAIYDHGTPQAQAKRHQLINGAPVELIATVAGVLCARGVLDDRQYRAALTYRRARAAIFGTVLPSRDPDRPTPGEDQVKILERRFERLAGMLTVDEKLALTTVTLDLWPRWAKREIHGLPLAAGDEVERSHLLSGLDVLAGGGRAEEQA